MSELKQIMPADGWYAEIRTDEGKVSWHRLMSFGLFKPDDGDTFIAGIVPIYDGPIDECDYFSQYVHYDDGVRDHVKKPHPLSKRPDIKIMQESNSKLM